MLGDTPTMDPITAARASRLRQLQGYLAQDPANPHLLADVCDAALAAGEHDVALQAIATAASHRMEPAAWQHRRAHVAIAQREWALALELLEALQQSAGHPTFLHDIALVHFRAGRFAACRETVQAALDDSAIEGDLLDGLQVLWLRSMHQLGLLEEAWTWVGQQRSAGRLQQQAMGVASLIAVDGERLSDARALAEGALAATRPVQEALVAGAYVALAQRQTDDAAGLLRRALASHPHDGRTWSAMGLASMQAGDLVTARRNFEQAVQTIPGHVGTWHALGWTCLLLQDLPAARAAFAQALERDRNFGESHGAMALVLLLEGRGDESGHHLRIAERLDSRGVTAGYVRAFAKGEARDAASVHALARRLLDRPGFFGGRLSDGLPPRPR